MDKNILKAVGLWALLAVPVLVFVSPRLFPPVPASPAASTPPITTPANGTQPPDPGPGPAPGPAPIPNNLPTVTREMSNGHIRAIFTTKGASLLSLQLLDYKERYLPKKKDPTGSLPLELLYEAEAGHRTFLLRIREGEKDPIDEGNWVAKSEPGVMPVEFQWTGSGGLTIVKRFTFSGETPYGIRMEMEISNPNAKSPYTFELESASGIAPENDQATDLLGLIARAERNDDGSRKAISAVGSEATIRNLKDNKEVVKTVEDVGPGWSAVANRYFVAALIPLMDSGNKFPFQQFVFQGMRDQKLQAELERFDPPMSEADAKVDPAYAMDQERLRQERLNAASRVQILGLYRTTPINLENGKIWKWSGLLYAGPKSEEELGKLSDYGLERSLDFGMWGFISRALLGILGVLRKICGNWGWAIVVLTVLVRCCIFPLNRKAQISAQKMSKLQPKLMEIKQRYEKDKEKLSQEMMKLYKDQGVNPVGGCVPVLLQLPILYGLYNALQMTLDLRQQPFAGWIRDLSQPDMLAEWHFGGVPCFCGAPMLRTEWFNLLPLVMMATWFVQSLTYPKPSDPQAAQTQKMMMWMPLLFGMMMFNTPSGLILYWMTSTFLGIIEQQIIRRVFLPRA